MEKYVPLVTKHCVRKILPDEIVYIMKKSRKIMIVTDKEIYEYYGKLEQVSQILDRRFFACLRGCIINLDKVLRMEEQQGEGNCEQGPVAAALQHDPDPASQDHIHRREA